MIQGKIDCIHICMPHIQGNSMDHITAKYKVAVTTGVVQLVLESAVKLQSG